jgi:alpha-glucosidase
VLQLYRRLLQLRKRSPGLVVGTQDLLAGPDGVLAYRRVNGDERWVVLINFTDDSVVVDNVASWTAAGEDPMVELASDGYGEGQPFSGRLGPDQAVVLRT